MLLQKMSALMILLVVSFWTLTLWAQGEEGGSAPPEVESPEPVKTAEPVVEENKMPTVQEITDFLDDLYRSNSSHGKMEMTIVTEYWERTLKLEQWSQGMNKSLIRILKPAKERGIATLKVDKDLWNYFPKTGEEMKIPSSLLADSWFGSHFSNDDLIRESSYNEDYDATIETGEVENGEKTLKLVLIPKPEAAIVYSKLIFVLRADMQPLRAEYMDDDGELVRTMFFKKIKEMGGRTFPCVMELRPADKPDEFTRVTYLDMEFDGKISKSKFTLRALRR